MSTILNRKSVNALKALLFFPLITTFLPFLISLLFNFVLHIDSSIDTAQSFTMIPLYIVFDIIILVYSIRNHSEMRRFIKIFLILGLLFTVFQNFRLAFLKFNGVQIPLTCDLYYGSMGYFLPFVYNDQSPLIFIGFYLSNLALVFGTPYLLVLYVLPSFLAVPFFFLWIVFSIFYIVTPYSVLQKIGKKE